MGLPAAKHRYTVEEYLRREAAAVDKHEFHEGEILAMSGGTYKHSLIAANVIGALWSRLRDSRCRALESNMRVRVPPTDRYVYPDAMVVCGQPQFDPQDPNLTTITNPRVIFEVLSESTEAYDRGAKFTRYREIESLEEFVLVSQDRLLVEAYARQPGGTWLLAPSSGIDAMASMRSLQISLPLSEIYLNVSFATPGDTDPSAPAG
jgi:Uma2 family endonuclease